MSIRKQLKQPGRGKNITGQDIMALERFMEETRHMIIYDVLEWECPVGDKGERIRIFLSDEGYEKALESVRRGEMKIIKHAKVRRGDLIYDAPERTL